MFEGKDPEVQCKGGMTCHADVLEACGDASSLV